MLLPPSITNRRSAIEIFPRLRLTENGLPLGGAAAIIVREESSASRRVDVGSRHRHRHRHLAAAPVQEAFVIVATTVVFCARRRRRWEGPPEEEESLVGSRPPGIGAATPPTDFRHVVEGPRVRNAGIDTGQTEIRRQNEKGRRDRNVLLPRK